MLYNEIFAVFSQIHTKRTNTFCGQKVENLLPLKYPQGIVQWIYGETLNTSNKYGQLDQVPPKKFTTVQVEGVSFIVSPITSAPSQSKPTPTGTAGTAVVLSDTTPYRYYKRTCSYEWKWTWGERSGAFSSVRHLHVKGVFWTMEFRKP